MQRASHASTCSTETCLCRRIGFRSCSLTLLCTKFCCAAIPLMSYLTLKVSSLGIIFNPAKGQQMAEPALREGSLTKSRRSDSMKYFKKVWPRSESFPRSSWTEQVFMVKCSRSCVSVRELGCVTFLFRRR